MLSILIHKKPKVRDTDPVAIAEVRENFSPLDERDARVVIKGRKVWDAAAKDRLGRPGALADIVTTTEIDAAVAQLRRRFGADLEVQNNLPADMIQEA